MKSKKWRAGFSLVETVVAMGVLTTSALGLSLIFNQVSEKESTGNQQRECIDHVNSIMGKFKSAGLADDATTFWPTTQAAGDRRPEGGGAPVAPYGAADGITSTHRWPGAGAQFDIINVPALPTDDHEIRNAHLIDGSINNLLAIYNSNTVNFCQGVTGDVYASVALFQTSAGAKMANVQTRIRIQPFTLQQPDEPAPSLAIACINNLILAPPGRDPDYGETEVGDLLPGGVAQNTAFGTLNYRNDVGLLVTLSTSYDDLEGNPQSCQAIQRFQYPEDNQAPNEVPAASFAFSGGNATGFNLGDTCAPGAAANNFTIHVGFSTAPADQEPGAVLLCRDTSYTYQNNQMASCITGPAPGVVHTHYQPRPSVAPVPEDGNPGDAPEAPQTFYDQTIPESADTPANAQIALSEWVPCNEVTICGNAPSAVAQDPALPAEAVRYELDYQNLPYNCHIRMEAIVVDVAGNVSAVRELDELLGANPLNPDMSIADYTNPAWYPFLVRPPRCGTYCGVSATYPNGYYECTGSC